MLRSQSGDGSGQKDSISLRAWRENMMCSTGCCGPQSKLTVFNSRVGKVKWGSGESSQTTPSRVKFCKAGRSDMKETKLEYDPNFPNNSSSVSAGRRGRPAGKPHHMTSERRRINSGSICKMGRWICRPSWGTQMSSRRIEENKVVVGDCTRSMNLGMFWALRKIVTWLLAKRNHPRWQTAG
jgi:hypothetical protein